MPTIKHSYPGRILKRGEKDIALVKIVQKKLNTLGCGPLKVDGVFGALTEQAICLFQVRFTNPNGFPLKVDGRIGPLTWASLFGNASVPSPVKPASKLLTEVLKIASSQVGVVENPLGSNRGKEVDAYIWSVGLNPTTGNFAWCVAFLYWCFEQASTTLKVTNPAVKTAGVHSHWNRAGAMDIPRITPQEAEEDYTLIKPGLVFCMDRGAGLGHAGIIESVQGGQLVTIEGNTNSAGFRNGIGVFRQKFRTIDDVDLGFVDYRKF